MSFFGVIKKTRDTVDRRSFIFAVCIIISPFLMYMHELFPKGAPEVFLGIKITDGIYKDFYMGAWVIFGRLVPLLLISSCFILIKSKISCSLFFPISTYFYQTSNALIKFRSDYVELKETYYYIPFLILFVVLLVCFKYWLRKREHNFEEKQKSLSSRLMELKNEALNSQMSPHFINNLLLSIFALLKEKNGMHHGKEILEEFSELVGLVLSATKSDKYSLDKELNLVELYVKLQGLRFQKEFTFDLKFETDSGQNEAMIRRLSIPPLTIQPLIENSILHGVRTLDAPIIKLTIGSSHKYVLCKIEDNGKGLSEVNDGLGSGISLKNIKERLALIDEFNQENELLTLRDLVDENGEIFGVETTLTIPKQS